MARKTTPPWALSPSGVNSEGGLSPRPTPSLSPCPQSGVVGEVADRFPGQHRGRLGCLQGSRGGARSHLATPPTHFPGLVTQPSLRPLVPRLSRPLLFPCPEAKQPWQLPYPRPVKARARLRQFELGSGAEGLTPAASCLLPPGGGAPLKSRTAGLSLPSRPEAMAREGPTLPSGSLYPSLQSFNFSFLAAPTFWPINILFVISKTNLKKNKTVKQVREGNKRKSNRQVQSALRSSLDATRTAHDLAFGLAAQEPNQAGLLRTKLSGRLGRS